NARNWPYLVLGSGKSSSPCQTAEGSLLFSSSWRIPASCRPHSCRRACLARTASCVLLAPSLDPLRVYSQRTLEAVFNRHHIDDLRFQLINLILRDVEYQLVVDGKD